MAFCGKCGSQVDEGVKFCPGCGAPVAATSAEAADNSSANTQTNNANAGKSVEEKVSDKFNEFNNTEDTTSSFDQNDINQNKVMAVLAYFGLLVLIPILAAKESKFARYHANQGLTLFLAEIVINVVSGILSGIPFIGLVFRLANLLVFILAIIGIINACNGKAKELPIIGSIRLLK